MKRPFKLRLFFQGVMFSLILFIISSCFSRNKILIENDIVNSTKRIELKHLLKDSQHRSPLLYLEQSIIKEIDSNDEVSIRVYDILNMTSSSFRLAKKVFIIVDTRIYQIAIDNIEYENVKNITENSEDVLTADSTTLSVVTGYSEDNRKITRFSYNLSDEIINKIKKSNQVLFRYYAGPSMITIKLKDKHLSMFKKLIYQV